MPYFKDTKNNLHHLDDTQFIYLLPKGSVKISDEEYQSLINVPETGEQTIARLESAIDRYLDQQAQLFRYESIRTMVTYVGDPNSQFNAEGVGALEFRSQCYTLALMIINEVRQGRPIPSEEELISEMPKLSEFVIY